jgi:four helix bundle protein
MTQVRSYRDLEVWRKAMNLAELCYRATEEIEKREVYGLASQVRRAAVSVASNIAEGHSRRSRPAYLNHLSIALSSQSEVETQIELASRLSIMPHEVASQILLLAEEVGRMLHGLVAALERGQSRTASGSPSPKPPDPSPSRVH